jgi:hypothetical protein
LNPNAGTGPKALRKSRAATEPAMANTPNQPPKKANRGGQRSGKSDKQQGMHSTTGTVSQPSEGNSPSKTGKAQPAGRATKSGM